MISSHFFRSLVSALIIILLLPISSSGTRPDYGRDSLYGTASWYSESDPGILPTTANMETFDEEMFTCAMWDVPFDTLVEVINLNNNRSVVVRVNDRGPARRLVREGRIIDLTKAAFAQIADLDKGLVKVRLRILGS